MEANYLKKLERRPANPAATALVGEARAGVVDIFTPWRSAFPDRADLSVREDASAGDARAPEIDQGRLDPDGIVNPGVLGLGGSS